MLSIAESRKVEDVIGGLENYARLVENLDPHAETFRQYIDQTAWALRENAKILRTITGK